MPTYGYRCDACGHELEQLQKITEEPLRQCPKCEANALIRGPGGGIGLSFKGSGFYITDYGQNKNIEAKNEPSAKKECCPCGKQSSCES